MLARAPTLLFKWWSCHTYVKQSRVSPERRAKLSRVFPFVILYIWRLCNSNYMHLNHIKFLVRSQHHIHSQTYTHGILKMSLGCRCTCQFGAWLWYGFVMVFVCVCVCLSWFYAFFSPCHRQLIYFCNIKTERKILGGRQRVLVQGSAENPLNWNARISNAKCAALHKPILIGCIKPKFETVLQFSLIMLKYKTRCIIQGLIVSWTHSISVFISLNFEQ